MLSDTSTLQVMIVPGKRDYLFVCSFVCLFVRLLVFATLTSRQQPIAPGSSQCGVEPTDETLAV